MEPYWVRSSQSLDSDDVRSVGTLVLLLAVGSFAVIGYSCRSRRCLRDSTTTRPPRVVGKIEDELLPSADGPQVGVVSIAPPALGVRVVGQGRLVALGKEPPRQAPIRHARAIGIGQDQPWVEPAKHSPSCDFAPVVVTAQFELCRRRVDGVPVVAVLRSEVGMMACPGKVIGPDVGDLMLLIDLEPAPQDVQLGRSLDEAPALGGFLDSAVEAEEQEDVAAANALLIQVALRDAGLAEHPSPLLPVGAVFPVAVCVEVQVGVQVDSASSAHAAVGDTGLEPLCGASVSGAGICLLRCECSPYGAHLTRAGATALVRLRGVQFHGG